MRLRSVFPAILACVALIASAAHGQTQRDSVMCYKIKPTKSACNGGSNDGAPCKKDDECPSGVCERLPKFVKGINVGLDDTLDPNNIQGLDPAAFPGEDFTYDVKKVKEVCAPAILDGAAIGDPNGIDGTHWIMYQIKQSKGVCGGDSGRACKKLDDCLSCAVSGPCFEFDSKFDKKDPRNTGVRIRDAFNDIRVDFGKEDMLMAPASEDSAGFLSPPSSSEFYKCYKVKPSKGVCTGGPIEGEACKKDVDCNGGTCVKPPKFPKETHPDGLSASIVDQFTTLQDPNDPEKTFDVRKIKMFCQAVDKKSLHVPEDLRIAEQAGLMCYQVKGSKKKCAATSPLNALKSCKKEEQCGGIKKVTQLCVELDSKFDKKDPAVLGRYVQDDIFSLGHRLDVAKEDLFCTPGCRGFGDFELTNLHAHVTGLALGLDGNPGSGVDVDGNAGTCAPASNCSGGIDNQLAAISGILNPVIVEQLESASLKLLFQADDLINGSTIISGFTGALAAAPGCAAGDPNDPNTYPVDPGNPADPCDYTADASSFFPDVRSTCKENALISLPVDITGADTAPSATATGGGPSSSFTLNLPFGDGNFTVTAAGVKVDADITHDTTDISEITGVLGGAVEHAVLVEAVASIQDTCIGGPNDQQDCEPTDIGTCPAPGSCQLSDSIPFNSESLAAFIQGSFPPDLDFGPGGNCIGGSNASEPCDVLADCPDQSGGTSCDPRESISLGLQFTATEANVTGIE